MEKTLYELVPYEVIEKAINGDVEAIQHVIQHYSRYMNSLSQKNLSDTDGNTYVAIDEEIKKCLEIKLVISLSKFKIA
ncbi:helix-turn-helix domain-containing protein [Clostridium algidicarnis]|uniref:helix-turn-helix domain-containing protein n=1 Tax=Clostridium algidicarnis TaxID=37659 RepID=UPI001C0D288A|nr:helix-turn-helix domain-containing protein [Clostridium algidicarnis]MBU3228409.1 helix-turn-helix domain-containing protein [Clostridium algidicarnis]MBU3252153.1 helix-turn-helix domain-containing protein [Clostridium algidicarnis]